MGMNVAVTGGLGFIGHAIVERLLHDGHVVTIVDYWKTVITKYEKHRIPILARTYPLITNNHVAGMLEPEEFLQRVREFDVIVHAGAVVDTMDLGEGRLWEENVEFTRRLVAPLTRAQTLVFISSAAVYGADGSAPNNPYGLSKVMGEKIVKRADCKNVSLRLFNVFGKHEHHKLEMASMPWKIANALRRKEKIGVHSLDSSRDFVHVSDVAIAVSQSISMGLARFAGEVYDVGTTVPTKFSDLIGIIRDITKEQNPGLIDVHAIPHQIAGRYQHVTRAGAYGQDVIRGMDTAEALRMTYG